MNDKKAVLFNLGLPDLIFNTVEDAIVYCLNEIYMFEELKDSFDIGSVKIEEQIEDFYFKVVQKQCDLFYFYTIYNLPVIN